VTGKAALEDALATRGVALVSVYRKHGAPADANARAALNREIGGIQLQMARRGQAQKGLREEIAKLEAELGTPSQK
jgi:hypothetical protein